MHVDTAALTRCIFDPSHYYDFCKLVQQDGLASPFIGATEARLIWGLPITFLALTLDGLQVFGCPEEMIGEPILEAFGAHAEKPSGELVRVGDYIVSDGELAHLSRLRMADHNLNIREAQWDSFTLRNLIFPSRLSSMQALLRQVRRQGVVGFGYTPDNKRRYTAAAHLTAVLVLGHDQIDDYHEFLMVLLSIFQNKADEHFVGRL
jgi:hypothetical protein